MPGFLALEELICQYPPGVGYPGTERDMGIFRILQIPVAWSVPPP